MKAWVTRVEPFHKAMIERLHKEGVDVVYQPLFTIAPIEVTPEQRNAILELDRYDQVAFVSKSAINHVMPLFEQYWPQWPVKQRWWAMGEGSKSMLESYHHEALAAKPATTEGLLETLGDEPIHGEKWLIVRGVGGREALKEALESCGAQVDYLEVYQRHEVEIPLSRLQSTVDNLSVIFVSSTQNLLTLSKLAANHREILDAAIIVPSHRTAQLAEVEGFKHIVTAKSASDDDMLKAWTNFKEATKK